MGSALDLQPFRMEWRPNAITHWKLISTWDTYGKADTQAEATLDLHKGQVRVVEQRVVRAKGLGLNESRPPFVKGVINPLTTIVREVP